MIQLLILFDAKSRFIFIKNLSILLKVTDKIRKVYRKIPYRKKSGEYIKCNITY